MGKGYKHGAGGTSLNFNVKAYSSETELKADNPRENTIGIIPKTTMTSWVFSANEPTESKVGIVWIPVGTSSVAEFNALKSNALQVYPLGVKQYVEDVFVSLPAFVYQGGKWVSWTKHLYEKGNQHTELTGGWTSSEWACPYDGFSVKTPSIGSTGITLATNSDTTFPTAGTKNKVDLSASSTVFATVETIGEDTTVYLAVNSEKQLWNDDEYPMVARTSTTETGEMALPVTGIDDGYVVVFAYNEFGDARTARITNIRIE